MTLTTGYNVCRYFHERSRGDSISVPSVPLWFNLGLLFLYLRFDAVIDLDRCAVLYGPQGLEASRHDFLALFKILFDLDLGFSRYSRFYGPEACEFFLVNYKDAKQLFLVRLV